jgi:hypothetical protein
MVMYVDFMTCIFLEMYVMYPLRLLRNFIYVCCLKSIDDVSSIS